MNVRWFEQPTKKNIWNCDEGRLNMVVNDLAARYADIDKDYIWQTLLKRGVLKWMAVSTPISIHISSGNHPLVYVSDSNILT